MSAIIFLKLILVEISISKTASEIIIPRILIKNNPVIAILNRIFRFSIIEFKERKSLLELVGIEQELEEKLGKKIDLLTREAISPYLINRIKKEAKVIFS